MNKKYKVEVRTERNGKDTYLSITHNGHQWTSTSIKEPKVEIPLIISALQRHLTNAMHSDGEGRCICSGFPHEKTCPEYKSSDQMLRRR